MANFQIPVLNNFKHRQNIFPYLKSRKSLNYFDWNVSARSAGARYSAWKTAASFSSFKSNSKQPCCKWLFIKSYPVCNKKTAQCKDAYRYCAKCPPRDREFSIFLNSVPLVYMAGSYVWLRSSSAVLLFYIYMLPYEECSCKIICWNRYPSSE